MAERERSMKSLWVAKPDVDRGMRGREASETGEAPSASPDVGREVAGLDVMVPSPTCEARVAR